MLEAHLEETELRPVEVLVPHRLPVVDGRRIVPAAVAAPGVGDAVAERIGEAVRPPEVAVGEFVVLGVVLDSRGEHRVLGRAPTRADARHEYRGVLSVVRILEVLHESVILVARRVGRVVELDRAVDVEVEERAREPVLLGLAQCVADAGRHAVPRIRQVARAAGELVEPVAARVDAVEAVEPLALLGAGDVGLLGEHVEIRLNDVRNPVVEVGGATRGKSHATFDYRAPGVVVSRPSAHVGGGHVAGVAPVRTPQAEARDDREDVGELHRQSEAVVRVEAESIVVSPWTGREAVLRRRVAAAVLRVVAVEIADTRLRLVVDGERPDRHRVDVKVELGKPCDAWIEVVQRTRDAHPGGGHALGMLPGEFVGKMGGEGVAVAHHCPPQEVMVEVRVAVVRRLDPDRVALGRLGAMLEAETVAVAIHIVAPVAVVPLFRVIPVAVVAARVVVPRIVDLELALAPVAETPPDGLADRDAVLRAKVEARAAREPIGALGHSAADAVDVLGEKRRAPPRGVAGHHSPTVVGVHRIVPVGKPHHGNVPHPEPRVAKKDVVPLAETHLARHLPVEMVPVVGARGEVGRVRELELAFGVACHRLGSKHNRRGDGLHVARGRERARDVVGGDPVGRDLHFAGRLSEKRCG